MVCARSAAVAPHRGPGITANARQPNKVIGVIGVIGVTAVHDPCRSFHSVRRRPIGIDTDARSTSRLLSSARSDDPRPRRPGRARSQRRACRHPIRPGASSHRVFPGQARVPPGFHRRRPPRPTIPTPPFRTPHHSEPSGLHNSCLRARGTTSTSGPNPEHVIPEVTPARLRGAREHSDRPTSDRRLPFPWHNTEKGTSGRGPLFLGMVSGGVLLSHTVAGAVPLALKGLASGFGMGPGVSPSLWPP
jgi:hypothetical protein